ncbi:Holliday junction resolvase RuvX [Candidatus Puniceispirillum sp.]|nr:Holliday junction resolvase RuvX [Candidatus Puniceispirillum sp.]
MTICKTNDLNTTISPGQRLLGLDIGKKTIGLALSDPGLKIASPLKIVYRKKFIPDAGAIIEIINSESIGGLVLGWPINMDGSAGPRCDSVRDFAHEFLKLRDIPIGFQDERLSTQAVERAMVAADMTRKKRAQRRDALAACWILQSALDTMNDERARRDLITTPPQP